MIRNATVRDVADIIRLERESSTAAHWNEQQYAALFSDDLPLHRLTLVAVEQENAALVGFLVARHASLEWELENIVVAEASRGIGIGKSLVGELLLRAQASESDNIFLEVRASNSAARRLYTRMGFEESSYRKGYYSNPPEDAVLYSKTLQKERISS